MDRIYRGFLIMVVSAILWLLPVTQGIYDFRTDLRTDTFDVTTAVATTNATVVLHKALYDNDTETISILSDLTTDSPVSHNYTAATRAVVVTGLSANATRELDVSYDVDALTGNTAVDLLMDWLPTIWILIIVAFPVCGLVAIIKGD